MIAAIYYDGQTSRQHAVRLSMDPAGVAIAGDGVERRAAWSDLRLSERTRHGPRLIEFADGARCEVRDTHALQALLRQHGPTESMVVRAQQSWRGVLAGLLACLAVLAAAYSWGLPWLADRVSRHIPASVVTELSRGTLDSLDRLTQGPSRLAEDRRERITARIRQMWPADEAVPLTIRFRQGGRLGANAMALPSGDIIVTDELVALADGDDEKVLAVLAHELGHVHHRHGMRMVLQSTVVGTLAAAYLGDVSSVVAGLTAAGMQLRYSRGFEFEADRYAARMLRNWGLSPDLLAGMLERLQAAHQDGAEREPAPDSESAGKQARNDYFSSHPDTAERIRRLRDR